MSSPRRAMSVAFVLAIVFGVGCLGRPPRLTLDLEQPVVQNPVDGVEVRIRSVEDRREFVARAYPGIPSLESESVTDRARSLRVYGRNTRGPDMVLPEGRTTEDLIRAVAANALRNAGFRVLDPADAGAIPVDVAINELWAWKEGWAVIFYNFRARLNLTGQLPAWGDGLEVVHTLRLASGGANVNYRWKSTMERGLQELTDKVAQTVGSPRAAPASPPRP